MPSVAGTFSLPLFCLSGIHVQILTVLTPSFSFHLVVWRHLAPGIIAPGAESVGQAQIVTGFAPAFTLEGLFGQADEEALNGPQAEDDGMQDGDEGEDGMQVEDGGFHPDEDEMDADDSAPISPSNPRKRRHSPTPSVAAGSRGSGASVPEGERAPKRMRKMNSAMAARPVGGMVGGSRKKEREGRKKARKDARRVGRAEEVGGGGMEVDVAETFMTS